MKYTSLMQSGQNYPHARRSTPDANILPRTVVHRVVSLNTVQHLNSSREYRIALTLHRIEVSQIQPRLVTTNPSLIRKAIRRPYHRTKRVKLLMPPVVIAPLKVAGLIHGIFYMRPIIPIKEESPTKLHTAPMELQNLTTMVRTPGKAPQVLYDLMGMIREACSIQGGRCDYSIPSPHISRVILDADSIAMEELVLDSGGYRTRVKADQR
jgi:hypothetical protein